MVVVFGGLVMSRFESGPFSVCPHCCHVQLADNGSVSTPCLNCGESSCSCSVCNDAYLFTYVFITWFGSVLCDSPESLQDAYVFSLIADRLGYSLEDMDFETVNQVSLCSARVDVADLLH